MMAPALASCHLTTLLRSGDDDHEVEVEVKAPRSESRHGSKTRAKTWVQTEVEQALVGANFIGDERN